MSLYRIIIGIIFSLLFSCIIIFFIYFYKSEPLLAEPCIQSQIETGDLILSSGESFKSRIVKVFENKSNNSIDYSHIGVFVRDKDSIYIMHMSVDANCIKKENLKQFILNNEVIAYDIYQMKEANAHKNQLKNIIDSIYSLQKPFDNFFDINSEDTYYCTELIYKSFLQADIKEINKVKYDKYLYPNDIINSGLFIKQNINYK